MNSPITSASVKVMRSYDYCHFEIVLGTAQDPNNPIPLTNGMVDDLRKAAARLADHAVEQYKIAKSASDTLEAMNSSYNLKRAQDTPESERTSQMKAIIKYHQDAEFAARFTYDYEDDYDPDYDDN